MRKRSLQAATRDQESAVASSDYQLHIWFAAYDLAVHQSAVGLLHYLLLSWGAVAVQRTLAV